ncbi:Ferric siderophore transport system, periplasmic binding protein TonB [hydrothermal vent metagenome]|uniref:Ferric siderophore transport system, periplasmic binding protein TonB n=1 Tax=hydrothermal vent metagenome TaxID=652676 RepID=A0A1W1CY34_9ZZZZ
MNRSRFALFVAILIHLLLFSLIYIAINMSPKKEKKHKQKEQRIKISLKELQKPKKVKTAGEIKRRIKPPKIVPPMPKGSQLKKIIHHKKIKPKPFKQKRKPKPKKVIQKQLIKPEPSKKLPIPYVNKENNLTKRPKKKEKIQDKGLSWLYEDRSNEKQKETKKATKNSSNISQNIKKLYGDTFGKLSAGEQKYILDNQEIMRRITQEILNRVARVNIPRNLNVNASNVIEFKLHPNGDMSDFRFLSKSGYYILDETTKETIEYAYSKYPLPKQTTLIRYNVFYNLAQY